MYLKAIGENLECWKLFFYIKELPDIARALGWEDETYVAVLAAQLRYSLRKPDHTRKHTLDQPPDNCMYSIMWTTRRRVEPWVLMPEYVAIQSLSSRLKGVYRIAEAISAGELKTRLSTYTSWLEEEE